MFQLAGDDEATSTANAGTVMTLETRLAGFSMTREQLRDPDSRYHKVSLAELKKTVPDFDWDAYLKNVGVTNIVNLNLGMPDFMTRATDDLRTIAVPGWRTYLRWHLLNAAAPTLTKAFVDEDFEFKGRVLTGTTEQQPVGSVVLQPPIRLSVMPSARICEAAFLCRGSGACSANDSEFSCRAA